MRILVKVITNAKTEEVIAGDGFLKIKVRKRPVEGEANKRVIELLSEYFKKPKSAIEIRLGHKQKEKVVEIAE